MLVSVTVKAGSAKGPLIESAADGSITVYLRERPHSGQANAALLRLLAKHYSLPQTSLRLKSGFRSKHKIIELPD